MQIEHLILLLYIFALSVFAGYQIIQRVPQLLHTPLMAFTNAISVAANYITVGAAVTDIPKKDEPPMGGGMPGMGGMDY